MKDEVFAANIRLETIKCLASRGFGHAGGCLSIADVLAVLYNGEMRIDPKNPGWDQRDLFVCSKGHAGPAVYAALALKGFFPMDMLYTLNQPGTRLPSHCDKNLTPGIDMTTGSLGQGMSLAVGMAFGVLDTGRRVYAIVGDGECDEGQVWEAAAFAAQHKLNNLIVFVDWNKKQLDGYTKDILNLGNPDKIFKSFGWEAMTIAGNDVHAIKSAIEKVKALKCACPTAIVLDTVKGCGVPEIAGTINNHHVIMDPELTQRAISHLEQMLSEA